MSKFQKSTIILGAIYLVFTIASMFSNIILEAGWSFKYTIWSAINGTLYTTAGATIALLLLFNAMQHKSKAAKTAAIIGGVWLVVLVCSHCIKIVGYYYSDLYSGDEGLRSMLHSLHINSNFEAAANIAFTFASVLQPIAIGFFADSHRKNKAVLISLIVYIVVFLFRLLFSLFGWSLLSLLEPAVYSELSHIISRTLAALCALAVCSVFACAATIKNKNYE